MNEKILKYNVIFQPEPEGGYTVVVPSLPGCVTYGKTLDEARKMATEAVQLYLESLQAEKEEIPSDDKSFISVLNFRSPNLIAV